jgi:hypothetical protein
VALTRGQFVVSLLASLPEASSVVTEHLDDQDGEVLLHLHVAEVRRLLLDAWQRQDQDVLHRGLAFLDAALVNGDERVNNAVAVSFVEDIAWWATDVQPFVATWPKALAAEVERQRSARG